MARFGIRGSQVLGIDAALVHRRYQEPRELCNGKGCNSNFFISSGFYSGKLYNLGHLNRFSFLFTRSVAQSSHINIDFLESYSENGSILLLFQTALALCGTHKVQRHSQLDYLAKGLQLQCIFFQFQVKQNILLWKRFFMTELCPYYFFPEIQNCVL